MSLQPYPRADHTRLSRVVQDVADLLHMGTLDAAVPADAENIRKITRWIGHVLRDANRRRKWWFLQNAHTCIFEAGADLFDLHGPLDRLSAVFIHQRLHPTTLEQVLQWRAQASEHNSPRGGAPTHYALEAGRRLHLWPCPHQSFSMTLAYQRPMHIAIVPDEWESLLLNGVIGMFGRHFDREQLAQDSKDFERRYRGMLTDFAVDSHDVTSLSWFEKPARAGHVLPGSAASETDTPDPILIPPSISGIPIRIALDGDFAVPDLSEEHIFDLTFAACEQVPWP